MNCMVQFTKIYNLNRHYERFHLNNDIAEQCLLCGSIFQTCKDLQKHYKRIHKPTKQFMLKESAHRKTVTSFRYTFPPNLFDFKLAQLQALPAIKKLLFLEASKRTLIKVSFIYICEMSMLDHVGEKMTTTMIPFRTPSFLANGYSRQGIAQNITKSFMLQERDMEEFCNSGSNWIFDRAIAFDVEISAMRPILVGNNPDESDFSETSTDTDADISSTDSEEEEQPRKKKRKPSETGLEFNVRDFKNKKFLFNPKNKDEKCFLYCLHEHLKIVRPKKYEDSTFKKFEKRLNLTGISFPISLLQIKKFLKQNANLKLKVNILLRNTAKQLFPLEFGLGDFNAKQPMNLILVQRKKEKSINNHFLLIKDIHMFTRKIYESKNLGKHSYEKSFLCCNCLNKFSSKAILQRHEEICSLNKPRIEKVSNEVISFKNFHHQHPLEYIAFLDFECVLPKVESRCPECTHLRCKCDRSFTEPMTEQFPVTFSLVILDQNSKIIHDFTTSSIDAADVLIDHLLQQEETWIGNLFKSIQSIEMTEKEWKDFNNSETCYMCLRRFQENDLTPCRDHCHYSGKYLGASCQSCNLKRQRPRKLHIFLHNGSKYDFHFIVKALNNKKGVRNIQILPYNGENFRTISFNSFVFVDSMSFLQSSLAKLSEDLSKTDNSYSILRQTSLVETDDKFDKNKFKLVTGKSFFPYEFW